MQFIALENKDVLTQCKGKKPHHDFNSRIYQPGGLPGLK